MTPILQVRHNFVGQRYQVRKTEVTTKGHALRGLGKIVVGVAISVCQAPGHQSSALVDKLLILFAVVHLAEANSYISSASLKLCSGDQEVDIWFAWGKFALFTFGVKSELMIVLDCK